MAELPVPQSLERATCPPHARTAVAFAAVKYTLMPVWLLPANEPVNVYAEGFAEMTQVAVPHKFPLFKTDAPDAGNVPPKMVKLDPLMGVTPAPVTCESFGIASTLVAPEHETPAHGFAFVSVLPYEVM